MRRSGERRGKRCGHFTFGQVPAGAARVSRICNAGPAVWDNWRQGNFSFDLLPHCVRTAPAASGCRACLSPEKTNSSDGQTTRSARALPQSRTRTARIQPPRARAGRRPQRARARAPAFPVHRRQQSRRVFRDPRSGPQGGDRRRMRRRSRRHAVARSLSPGHGEGAGTGRAPVRRCSTSEVFPQLASRGHPFSAPQQVERGADADGSKNISFAK